MNSKRHLVAFYWLPVLVLALSQIREQLLQRAPVVAEVEVMVVQPGLST